MKKLKSVLEHYEFHVLLFILCIIMFFSPLFILSDFSTPGPILLSFFIPWALIIAILYFTGQSYSKRDTSRHPDKAGRGTDV